jgi:drug/metabolite transporter (DMT)-like permease
MRSMIKKTTPPLFGAYAFLVLAQVMVGINIVGSKYLIAHVSILFILTTRFSLAALFLFLMHRLTDQHPKSIRRHLEKLTQKDWKAMALQALTAGVLFNGLMIMGLRYTHANIAGIITSGLPAMIAVMSWIVLKEHFSFKKSLCVGLATIGLLVISADKFLGESVPQSMLGNTLILLSLLPEAAYYVLSKMHVNPLPIFLLSGILNAINACIMLPILFFYMNWHSLHLTLWDGGVLVLIGMSSALFFVFWYLGSYKVDGVMASLSTAVMPIATVIIAGLALGEVISGIELLGMGLVLASIFAYVL